MIVLSISDQDVIGCRLTGTIKPWASFHWNHRQILGWFYVLSTIRLHIPFVDTLQLNSIQKYPVVILLWNIKYYKVALYWPEYPHCLADIKRFWRLFFQILHTSLLGKIRNPLTTCKHYPEEVSIILLFFILFQLSLYIDLSQLVRLKIFHHIQQLNFLYALASR